MENQFAFSALNDEELLVAMFDSLPLSLLNF
jgi:hypothetical protein